MGTISSGIGLVTGTNISDTVSKLVSLQSASRDALVNANKALNAQQTAVTSLEALLVGLQFTTNRLSASTLYSQQTVTSSNPAVLAATATGTAALGSYQFTPLRTVQAQQYTSSRLASSTSPLGAGSFSFRFGGYVDKAASLDVLNGGQGFDRGKIRITDRSGATADIDLSQARTAGDVLDAITAEAHGDSFRLIDKTGANTANLRVEEVSGGTTAASLGLSGINTATTQANGADVISLFNDLPLSQLNQGNGVRFDNALADLKVSFRDGSESTIDFHKLGTAGTQARATTASTTNTNGRLTITAAQAGAAYAGVSVSFQNDNTVTAGNETVSFDALSKSLTFRISAGHTTANNLVTALGQNSSVSALFTASRPAGSDGTGLVSTSDTTITAGPQSSATTAGHISNEANLVFTAVQGGAAYDGVTVRFVNNPAITAGHETVAYDASDPANKQLVFQIAEGQTTGLNVINALQNDPTASALFTAARATGANGNGAVSSADTVITSGGAIIEPIPGTSENTIGDVLATLNAAAPSRLHAAIGPDGDRIVLTDLTADAGHAFSLTDLNGAHVAADLGLTNPAATSSISGRRVLGGLQSSLLSSLNGGQGINGLGVLSITNRAGSTSTVDLSSSETLQDAVDLINVAGLGVTAGINSARSGLQLTDTTGSTTSNLIAANGDGSTTTADRLGIAGSTATTRLTGSNLKLQVVNEQTSLASLNGGAGIPLGSFTVVDTTGSAAAVNVSGALQTVGDLLHEINSHGLAVNARLNDAGDGIVLVDTAHGGSPISVTDGASGSAAGLHLLGSAISLSVAGVPTQAINGSTVLTFSVSSTESITDLVKKINDSKSGVQAALFSDGSTVKPFRFTLTSQVAGKAGELQVDSSQLGFTLDETVKAQDALLLYNTPGSAAGLLASSSTNSFKNVLAGVTLDVSGASAAPITVGVNNTDTNLVATALAIVDGYNRVHDKLASATSFDASSNKRGPLQGDGAALRVQADLASLVTSRHFGLGSIQTLSQLGFSLGKDGTLTFDQTALKSKFAGDPGAVQKFFSTATTGISDKFKVLIDQLSGADKSLLVYRNQALDRRVQANQLRIDEMNKHLATVSARLTQQFQQSEITISKIQNALSALSSIAQAASGYNSTYSPTSNGTTKTA